MLTSASTDFTPTKADPAAQINRLDARIFDRISSQSSTADRKALLAIQRAVRERSRGYVYLEIGSHLGGSIQPHLLDPRCKKIYSIDARPEEMPDERGEDRIYRENSTRRMLDLLAEVSEEGLGKIVCFDQDARYIDPRGVDPAPHLCFIDGEHTNEAVISDFAFCFKVSAPDAVIAFHDSGLVSRGIKTIKKWLHRRGASFRGLKLDGSVYALCLGASAGAVATQLRPLSINEGVYFTKIRLALAGQKVRRLVASAG